MDKGRRGARVEVGIRRNGDTYVARKRVEGVDYEGSFRTLREARDWRNSLPTQLKGSPLGLTYSRGKMDCGHLPQRRGVEGLIPLIRERSRVFVKRKT